MKFHMYHVYKEYFNSLSTFIVDSLVAPNTGVESVDNHWGCTAKKAIHEKNNP